MNKSKRRSEEEQRRGIGQEGGGEEDLSSGDTNLALEMRTTKIIERRRVILARERSERVMGEGVLRLRHKDTIVERGQLVHQVVVLLYPIFETSM